MKLLIGNDQTISLLGLRDAATDETIDAATVEVTVKARNGAEVAGQTWPLQLTPNGAGNYSGILEDGLELAKGTYQIEISIDAGNDLIGFFKYIVPSGYRGPDEV